MASFTAPDGSKVTIDEERVVRIRATISGENREAKTRVDWATMSLIKEPLEQVVRSSGPNSPRWRR